MNTQRQIEKLIRDAGGKLVRKYRHQIWKLPNGKTFVVSNTVSDNRHALANVKSNLRKALQ